jgi:ATP-dependent Clp protease ATP-binding subunit ClpA
MFERFTKDARAAVVMAQEEARSLRHDHVGTEHVLLGTLVVSTGPGAWALRGLGLDTDRVRRYVAGLGAGHDDDLDAEALATVGIDLAEVRRAAEESFGPGALDQPRRRWHAGHIPFDRAAKKSLELSVREALRHKDNEIGDAYVLLGVIRAEPNPATATLRALGVEPDAARDAIERELRGQAA